MIDVNDQLPEYGQRIWARVDDKWIRGYYFGSKKFFPDYIVTFTMAMLSWIFKILEELKNETN